MIVILIVVNSIIIKDNDNDNDDESNAQKR